MVVWRWPNFLFPVELLDLPRQFADGCPPCPIYCRDPARPQIAVTVYQKLHVIRSCPLAGQIGIAEGSTEQGIATCDLRGALRRHWERYVCRDRRQIILV